MPVHNADIAAIFTDIADLLEIQGENPYRIRAYRNAARSVGEFGRDLASIVNAGDALPKIPGIGVDLGEKLHEIVTTGHCTALDKLRRRLPPAITELLKIPGLGPKRVRALNRELGVATVDQLQRAARAGDIRALPGFGEKTENRILEGLVAHATQAQRIRRAAAAPYAEALVAYLKRVAGVRQVTVAGSYRRMKDTVGDLDILVTASAGVPVMERFTAYDEVRDVLAHGETRCSVVLRCGLQVDLRLVPAESYGAALYYFTGSRAHNIAVRRIAQACGLKINEYGVFRDERRIAGATEEAVFAAVGLPYIPPELREDRGEIEAARAGHLPQLVTFGDLRGDLHMHTRASDGKNTVREMALAATAVGFDYIAITEHSRRLAVARGLDALRVARQGEEIDSINAELPGITVLKGIEVDVLDDGSLDLPDGVLAQLDVVIAAVHGRFDLPRRRQTERVLRALDNPYVTMLAHPTGRLLGERAACELDMLAVMRKAKERGIALELNAQPDRLDLDDVACQMARAEGVFIIVNSDSHSTQGFAHLRDGIGQARRGWLECGDVLNTRSLAKLRAWLAARRGREQAAAKPVALT